MKILLLDDHEFILSLVGKILEDKLCAEVIRIKSTEELANHLNQEINIFVVDINLEKGSGFTALQILADQNIESTIIYTSNTEPEVIELLSKHRYIFGVVSKASPETELINAINAVGNKPNYYCIKTNQILNSKRSSFWELNNEVEKLTSREIEVLELIWKGLTTDDISSNLNISTHTIENHRKNIKRKLKQETPVGILREALKQGYINTLTEY